MASIRNLKDNGGIVFYPLTHERAVKDSNGVSLESKLAGLESKSYVEAWDGTSTPVEANIPAGVTVTYNTTTYTGTLAASSSTIGKIYLVKNGNDYDRYITSQSGSSYSWSPIGSSEMDLSGYATDADLGQLQQEVTDVIAEGKIAHTIVSNRYIDPATGSENPYNGWDSTGYVNVADASKIEITQGADTTYNCWYNINKTRISSFSLINGTKELDVPRNAVYFRVSNTTAGMASFACRVISYKVNKVFADNIDIALRGNISFEDNKVTFGAGYLYLTKAGVLEAYYAFETETTYTFPAASSNYLVFTLSTSTISIKSTVQEGDFVLLYYDGVKCIASGALYKYYLNEKIDGVASDISDINSDIANAGFVFDNSVGTGVDLSNRIDNKYLVKDTAVVGSYSGYFISDPILLSAKQALVGKIYGNDVCVLAETDENATSYRFVQNARPSGTTEIKYVASSECYVAVCGRTDDIGTITNLSIVDTDSLEETLTNVKNYIDSSIENPIPSFVLNEAQDTFLRYQSWKGADECLVFPIITDLHSSSTDTVKYKAIPYCIETNLIFGYNFIAHLGDFGLGNDGSPTLAKAHTIMNRIAESFGKYYGRVFFAQGNHDSDFKASLGIGQVDVENYMAQPYFNKYPEEFVADYSHQSFYVDFSKLKIRVLVINTTDKETGGNYGMTDEQLGWIYDSLLNTPNGYCVVILSHFCVNKIGEWTDYVSDTDYAFGSTTQLMAYAKMLEAFANKASVSYSGYSFDFTGLDSSIKLVGNICGDSHFDAQLRKDETVEVLKTVDGTIVPFEVSGNGVNYIITQSYGSVPTTSVPSWAIFTQFDKSTQLLIDVVAIKPRQGVMKLFRIGAGGSARDRAFTF